jgi:hypothetical protein
MATIKLSLGDSLQYAVAERCVAMIHEEIVNRHLGRIGYAKPYRVGQAHREVCELFRAMENRDQRRKLRGLVKYLLTVKMKECGTKRCWQDYIRAVAHADGLQVPASNTDPLWSTLVLKSREAAAA